MANEAHVEGLLHLAAISVAVTIGYLGIDRVHRVDTNLQEEIKKAAIKVDDKIIQYDINFKDGKIDNFVFRFMPLYILLHVTGKKLKHGFMFPIRIAAAQIYVPLLPYFRRRIDFYLVSILCIISTGLFFFLTACTQWEIRA